MEDVSGRLAPVKKNEESSRAFDEEIQEEIGGNMWEVIWGRGEKSTLPIGTGEMTGNAVEDTTSTEPGSEGDTWEPPIEMDY